MTDPQVRASDADRQRVVAQLERHTAAGRLTLDEYAERVDSALAARTHGDLGAVVADLPAETVTAAEQSEDRRHLLVAFLVAALVVVAFAVVLGLAR